MAERDTGPQVSRRRFLAASGVAGAAAVGVPIASGAQKQEAGSAAVSPLPNPPLGRISPEGRKAIADVDRQFQQQQPKMQKTVSAVDNLGLDPSGKQPISGKLGSALSGMANTRVTFPSDGVFLLPEKVGAQPDGPIKISGNGCTFKIPSDTQTKSFNLVLPSGSSVRDITIDQSAKGALQELAVQADGGVVRADNVTIKGYAPAKGSPQGGDGGGGVDQMFAPIARTSNATLRVTNFQAVGGTAAGTHNEGDLPPKSPENVLDSPMGVGVFDQNKGTIQLVNPKLSGWSNGIYGGRTKGIVEVLGGKFVNNFNSQTRVSGRAVVDGASMLLDDRKWSDKGPFKIGHQGVYAVRVDPSDEGNQTQPAKFINIRIIAKSMREGAALFDWEPEAGPGIVRNCHITNHLDRTVFLGESPQNVPAATNILVDKCLIDGSSSAGVMEMHDREQSRIQRTCIKLPDAGPGDIKGAQIGKGMSFGGKCKSGSGLSKPKKVGSGGNLSSLPAPTNASGGNSSTGASASQRKRKQRKRQKTLLTVVYDGILPFLFLILAPFVLFILGGLALLGGLAALLGGD
jgi:hypothetical protein